MKSAKDKRRQKADISIIDITAYDRTPRCTNLHQSQKNVKRGIDYWLNKTFSRKNLSKTKDMNEKVLSEKVQNGLENCLPMSAMQWRLYSRKSPDLTRYMGNLLGYPFHYENV